ncbi:MAG TPA: ankyrin repeat domain-containing protein [Burkholderiales bacterium]|nr:ankyrin repeat domain-containing protein [Burkholderiales bacterium]
MTRAHRIAAVLAVASLGWALPANAQVPPSAADVARYTGLHAAAASGNLAEIERLVASGADREARDGNGRTPLHVAVYRKKHDAARLLLAKGANANALDRQRYDVVTIAAVADDVPMLRIVLEGGASAKNVTSPYDGTALIAAAHLGHVEIVQTLIKAGAPLDHVNNLTWTALMESIVLGDGGKRHTETLRALVQAGANVNIPDRAGITPLAHARGRGYKEMAQILEKARAR